MSQRQRPCAVLFGTQSLAVAGAAALHETASLTAQVAALKRAGVDQIALVISAGTKSAATRLKDVRIVLHSGAWNSAFDEIVLGLFALERAPVLLLPADYETLSDETLAVIMAEANEETASHALVPFRDGRSSFPVVLFKAGVEAAIREAARPHGIHRLESLIDSWRDGVRTLAVARQQAFGAQA
jgi:hypothetical protein